MCLKSFIVCFEGVEGERRDVIGIGTVGQCEMGNM